MSSVLASEDATVSSKIEHAVETSAPATSEEPEAIVYPSGLKVVIIISALLLAVFLVALDQTIVATAIPKITDRFKSVSDIGWYGSVWVLSALSLIAMWRLIKISRHIS